MHPAACNPRAELLSPSPNPPHLHFGAKPGGSLIADSIAKKPNMSKTIVLFLASSIQESHKRVTEEVFLPSSLGIPGGTAGASTV